MDESQLNKLVQDMLPIENRQADDQQQDGNFSRHEDSSPKTPRMSSSNSSADQIKLHDQSGAEDESDQEDNIEEEEASDDSDGNDSPASPIYG